jgi:hypothetical protein
MSLNQAQGSEIGGGRAGDRRTRKREYDIREEATP